MERESFEDKDVSELLNKNFICIKVDKEERPDIDAVYMTVCQALTGSGGWPLSIFLMPDQKPFYAATYIPKENRYGRMGMMELLAEIMHLWKNSRSKLVKSSTDITKYLINRAYAAHSKAEPDIKLINRAVSLLNDNFDHRYGGFGSAPKFPAPHNLLFLLRFWQKEKEKNVMPMIEKTLIQMYRGGIFDHLGGGFSRYSTDEKWLVPHFEKMLYDNALLSYVYLECFQVTKEPLYEHVARRTLDYVMKELSDKDGAFYCGQDADSEGVEGKYYVFTPDEINEVIGKENASTFKDWFSVTERGNFEGKNILNLLNNADYDEFRPIIQNQCEKLYDYRLGRTRLHLDDKVLTSWNALMISSLAKAGAVLEDSAYLNNAVRACHFIENNLVQGNGRLFLRWRRGSGGIEGQLDDYAFYAWSLLELYESTFDIIYLKRAVEIAKQMLSLFYDEENGGFYMYSQNGEQLISRLKELYDGAVPSGNSVAALVLTRLSKLTGLSYWDTYSKQQLFFLAGSNKDNPAAHTFSMIAMLEVLYPSRELICVINAESLPEGLLGLLHSVSGTNLTVLVKTKDNETEITAIAPFLSGYELKDNQNEAYYLCENFSCKAPVHTVKELQELLA